MLSEKSYSEDLEAGCVCCSRGFPICSVATGGITSGPTAMVAGITRPHMTAKSYILLFHLGNLPVINGLFTGILNAPVRVKDHPFFKRPVSVGHPDSRQDSAGSGQVIADGPTNEFTVKKINHAREVKESILAGDVSSVGHTCLRRLFLVELTIKQIRCHIVVVERVSGYPELLRELAAQPHLSRMTSHGRSGNSSSRCLQIFSQPGPLRPLASKYASLISRLSSICFCSRLLIGFLIQR